MPANVLPNFVGSGVIAVGVAVTAGNTSSEGGGTIGTSIFLALTAGANGDFVELIRWMPTASAAGTSTTATVGRMFLSTQTSGATTSANTTLIGEVTLPSVTADSTTTPVNPVDFPLGWRIPANNTILVTNHVAPAASTQWVAVCVGGDY